MNTSTRGQIAILQADRQGNERGFTLIELMIAVAVIGILAAIAYPSYQDSIRKSRRADAKATLLQAAQWMERFYTENNRYDPRSRAGTLTTTITAVPHPFQAAPLEGGSKYYAITLAAITQNTFTLNATPCAAIAGYAPLRLKARIYVKP